MVLAALQRDGDNPSEFYNESTRNVKKKKKMNIDLDATENVSMTHISWSAPLTAPL